MTLTIEDVNKLLAAMIHSNRPAEVDWTNRRIMVLSEDIPTYSGGTRVILSDGPAVHRDYIFVIDGKGK